MENQKGAVGVKPLSLKDMSSAFIVLGLGISLAFLVFLIERIIFRFTHRHHHRNRRNILVAPAPIAPIAPAAPAISLNNQPPAAAANERPTTASTAQSKIKENSQIVLAAPVPVPISLNQPPTTTVRAAEPQQTKPPVKPEAAGKGNSAQPPALSKDTNVVANSQSVQTADHQTKTAVAMHHSRRLALGNPKEPLRLKTIVTKKPIKK